MFFSTRSAITSCRSIYAYTALIFGWLYAEAARGTYEEGAVAALAIVLAGLLPVILLARTNLKMGH